MLQLGNISLKIWKRVYIQQHMQLLGWKSLVNAKLKHVNTRSFQSSPVSLIVISNKHIWWLNGPHVKQQCCLSHFPLLIVHVGLLHLNMFSLIDYWMTEIASVESICELRIIVCFEEYFKRFFKRRTPNLNEAHLHHYMKLV